jgi:hypothetical protein
VSATGSGGSTVEWAATVLAGTTTPLLKLSNPDYVVGIALNGVFLFAGASQLGYDAFFP